MKSKLFAWIALAGAAALPGASTLAAQDWRGVFQNDRQVRSNYRPDSRDAQRDRVRIERLRADIARDEFRLDQAIRRGRRYEVARLQRELARDRQELRERLRDFQRYDAYYGRR